MSFFIVLFFPLQDSHISFKLKIRTSILRFHPEKKFTICLQIIFGIGGISIVRSLVPADNMHGICPVALHALQCGIDHGFNCNFGVLMAFNQIGINCYKRGFDLVEYVTVFGFKGYLMVSFIMLAFQAWFNPENQYQPSLPLSESSRPTRASQWRHWLGQTSFFQSRRNFHWLL